MTRDVSRTPSAVEPELCDVVVERENDSGLIGTLVSPRSGEYKAKSVSLNNGAFEMTVDREIEGNSVTFVYKGNLKDSGLSGTLQVKGYGDQFTGNWKATR